MPRDAYTWGIGSVENGNPLAMYIGMLGGPVTHDQIAQLNMNPGPLDGYTLIASTGQIEQSGVLADRPQVGTAFFGVHLESGLP